MDTKNLATVIIQAATFIAAFAAITANILMSSVVKKFGTGILASGFKTISVGIFLIAIAIILDVFNFYFQSYEDAFILFVAITKEILFVLGTFIIVIASKRTADKLESLTK